MTNINAGSGVRRIIFKRRQCIYISEQRYSNENLLTRNATNQTKQKFKLLTFFEMTPCFRGVSAQNFAEKKKWSARTYAKSR